MGDLHRSPADWIARQLRPGAVHEFLVDPKLPAPMSLPWRLQPNHAGRLVWIDSQRQLYPLALRQAGVDLERLLILRPDRDADHVWAIAECLACPAVAAVTASVGKLTPVQARRLQLAAENGGGRCFLFRPAAGRSLAYAAATRWLVRTVPGTADLQRFSITPLHGISNTSDSSNASDASNSFNASSLRIDPSHPHDAAIANHTSILLEIHRETNHVCLLSGLADRSVSPWADSSPGKHFSLGTNLAPAVRSA